MEDAYSKGASEGGTFPNTNLVDPMLEVSADVANDPASNVMDPGFRKPVFDIQYTQGRVTSDSQ